MHIRRWGVAASGLDPLLNRIARNLLIDRYRRISPHLVSLDDADEIQDPNQDPTEEVARRQRRSAVQSAIRSLPTRHQKAITYSLSGLSPEEVGKEMGIGRNAADALLHRARRSLREHLAPVRDGMWGLAVAVRMRMDRITRRSGIEQTAGEAASSVLIQSGMGVAAIAMVATLGFAGSAGGANSRFASIKAHSARSQVSSLMGQVPGSASVGSMNSTGGGSSGSGGNSFHFGSSNAGGAWGQRNMDGHASAPGNDPNGKGPLVDIGLHSYPDSGGGYSGPAAKVVNPTMRYLCGRVSADCGS